MDWCKKLLSDSDLQSIQAIAKVTLKKIDQEKLSEALAWYIRRISHLDALRPDRKERAILENYMAALEASVSILSDFFICEDALAKQLFLRVMSRECDRQSSERSKMPNFPYVFKDVSNVLSELKLSLDEEIASAQIDNGGREAENAARDELFFQLSEIYLARGGLQKNLDQFIPAVCAKLPPDLQLEGLKNTTILQAINRHKRKQQ